MSAQRFTVLKGALGALAALTLAAAPAFAASHASHFSGSHSGAHPGSFHGGAHVGSFHGGAVSGFHGGYRANYGGYRGGYHGGYGYRGAYGYRGFGGYRGYHGFGGYWPGYLGLGLGLGSLAYDYSYYPYAYSPYTYDYGYYPYAYDTYPYDYGADYYYTPPDVDYSPGWSVPPSTSTLVTPDVTMPPADQSAVAPADDRAHIEVVPPTADAQVLFNGRPTQQTGPDRQFVSPPLNPGQDYRYTIEARWDDGGRPMDETRSVTVRAGESAIVNFTK
jgi:uncharacterized protein (TIGR03000 family)